MPILNVMRLELAKNRRNINRVIGNMQTLFETMTSEFHELNNFVHQYFHLITVTNKVCQTSQSNFNEAIKPR